MAPVTWIVKARISGSARYPRLLIISSRDLFSYKSKTMNVKPLDMKEPRNSTTLGWCNSDCIQTSSRLYEEVNYETRLETQRVRLASSNSRLASSISRPVPSVLFNTFNATLRPLYFSPKTTALNTTAETPVPRVCWMRYRRHLPVEVNSGTIKGTNRQACTCFLVWDLGKSRSVEFVSKLELTEAYASD